MTDPDSATHVTCLVCGGTLSLERARAGEACAICGHTNWDPPIVREPEPTVEEEVVQPVDHPDSSGGDGFVPPYVPSRPRRRGGMKLVVIAVLVVVIGVVIQQVWAFNAAKSPSGSAPTASMGVESSLKKGQWVLVLESLPKKTKSQKDAYAVASRLAKNRSTAVLDSNRVPGLTNGYWAVVALPFSTSKNAATSGCRDFGRKVGGSCYARQVK